MRGSKKSQGKTITIRGVVALTEWSDTLDDGDVVILTDDDEEYFIEVGESQIRPAKFVNARVEASGNVCERDDQQVLAVHRMRVIDSIQDFSSDYGTEDFNEDDFDDTFDGDLDANSWSDAEDVSSYARLLKGSGF